MSQARLGFAGTVIRRIMPRKWLEESIWEMEVPRYPPFARGFPVVPAQRLLDDQQELLGRIRIGFDLTDKEYDRLVKPVLENLTKHAHLLPASEHHHHRGAGGLLRHSLEVAYFAMRSSEGVIFVHGATPGETDKAEPRWRMAAFLTGLLHDSGKPLTDLSVVDKSGMHEWNPWSSQTIVDWADEKRLDRYFLRWRKGRHRRHEGMASFAMTYLIPNELATYLNESDPNILRSVWEAVTGYSVSTPLSKLMLRADSASVEQDLREQHIDLEDSSAVGVAVERYIVSAMRVLVSQEDWKANKPSSVLWIADDKTAYIDWRRAAKDVTRALKKDNVPGIPQEADTLAEILLDRGLVEGQPIGGNDAEEDNEKKILTYWQVQVNNIVAKRKKDELQGSMRFLGLKVPLDVIYSNNMPPPPHENIQLLSYEDSTGEAKSTEGEGDQAEEVSQASESVEDTLSETRSEEVQEATSDSDSPGESTEASKERGEREKEESVKSAAKDALSRSSGIVKVPRSLPSTPGEGEAIEKAGGTDSAASPGQESDIDDLDPYQGLFDDDTMLPSVPNGTPSEANAKSETGGQKPQGEPSDKKPLESRDATTKTKEVSGDPQGTEGQAGAQNPQGEPPRKEVTQPQSAMSKSCIQLPGNRGSIVTPTKALSKPGSSQRHESPISKRSDVAKPSGILSPQKAGSVLKAPSDAGGKVVGPSGGNAKVMHEPQKKPLKRAKAGKDAEGYTIDVIVNRLGGTTLEEFFRHLERKDGFIHLRPSQAAKKLKISQSDMVERLVALGALPSDINAKHLRKTLSLSGELNRRLNKHFKSLMYQEEGGDLYQVSPVVKSQGASNKAATGTPLPEKEKERPLERVKDRVNQSSAVKEEAEQSKKIEEKAGKVAKTKGRRLNETRQKVLEELAYQVISGSGRWLINPPQKQSDGVLVVGARVLNAVIEDYPELRLADLRMAKSFQTDSFIAKMKGSTLFVKPKQGITTRPGDSHD